MDVLIALNLQNSFLWEEGSVYMGEKAEILKVRLNDFLSRFRGKKMFSRETHAEQDDFFITDKTHSIATTPDHDIHKDLKKYVDLKDDKSRYDALYNTKIEMQIQNCKTKNVTLVGLETHTSVLFTAESLRNRGYDVTVVEPCVMSRDDYLHGCAIAIMRHSLGVRITNG